MIKFVIIFASVAVASCAGKWPSSPFFSAAEEVKPELYLDPDAPAIATEKSTSLLVVGDSAPKIDGGSKVETKKSATDIPVASVSKETEAVVSAPEVVATPSQEKIVAGRNNSIAVADPAPESSRQDVAVDQDVKLDAEEKSAGFSKLGSGPTKLYVRAGQMNIRVKPDRHSKILGLIYGGDEVHVTLMGDWAMLDEGRWIRSRWLTKDRPTGVKGRPMNKQPLEISPGNAEEKSISEDSGSLATVDRIQD
jgi:hypothetical protein